ncbi:hypothetical protein AGR1C_Lc10032 [Agrobacterium fabacearum TT111]|nr:hypothetical protein AGR1C_Lc10032 [Agrobacterium fabacearum TT111]
MPPHLSSVEFGFRNKLSRRVVEQVVGLATR